MKSLTGETSPGEQPVLTTCDYQVGIHWRLHLRARHGRGAHGTSKEEHLKGSAQHRIGMEASPE
jgi:hypothetical protein